MFHSLGRAVHRRRWWVLGIWLVAIVAGVAAGGPLAGRVTAEFRGSERLEAARVQHRLDELSSTGGDIVVVADGVDPFGPVPRPVATALDDLAAVDGVVAVLDPWSTGIADLGANDSRAALIVVSFTSGLDAEDERTLAESVAEVAAGLADGDYGSTSVTEVLVGGEPIVVQEFETQAERDLVRGEMIALPIALVAMIFIFGGVRAAGMPLAVAAAAYLSAVVALLGATFLLDSVSVFAINVVSMLGLGLGIDYGLLLVSRFREERGTGATVADAVEATIATAGVTVLFSALTVAVAMSGMFVFNEPTMTSFGIGGLAAVIFSMLAALTLLPALLSLVGAKIKPAPPRAPEQGAFYHLARFVQRFALPVLVVVGGGLALLAGPFLDARLENGDARSLPRSSQARAAASMLAERFPARGADPIIVVADTEPGSVATRNWLDDLATFDGVAGLTVRDGFAPGLTVVDVVPLGTSQGDVAAGLVADIRARDTTFPVEVGGIAANTIDTRAMIEARIPYAIGVVVIATFVLLFLMTGSLAVPAKAVIMNVLSLGATFGALVWVFQEGNLADLLAFDPVGSLDLWLPTLIFLFAFGLSMDYEVFLLSRIKEIHDRTGDNDLSVAQGLQKTGRIITSAALLIVVVFAGFAAGETLTIKQLGVGLALAVIVDATIVRALLVPATMKLLGRWNWWAPAPLARFHARFGLHEPADARLQDRSGPGDGARESDEIADPDLVRV